MGHLRSFELGCCGLSAVRCCDRSLGLEQAVPYLTLSVCSYGVLTMNLGEGAEFAIKATTAFS